MAKNKFYLFSILCAVSGLLLTAFFIAQSKPKKIVYQRSKHAILLSYIPSLDFIGGHEHLSSVSLKQPHIFEESSYSDVFLELESLQPIIDSVIALPDQFKVNRKV